MMVIVFHMCCSSLGGLAAFFSWQLAQLFLVAWMLDCREGTLRSDIPQQLMPREVNVALILLL